jgi:hypothetical protein
VIARIVRLLEKAERLLDTKIQIAEHELQNRKNWPWPTPVAAPFPAPAPTVNPTPWWEPFPPEPIDPGVTWSGDTLPNLAAYGTLNAACAPMVLSGQTFVTTFGGPS